MASDSELNAFLKSVETRAFKRAVYAVRDQDAALDIVQDAMIRLAQSYGHHAAAEWPMLFQRILSNAIMDWFRRQKVRRAVMQNFTDLESPAEPDGSTADLLETLMVGGAEGESAAEAFSRTETLELIEEELARLPHRQREAFLLRYWEELDLAETAEAMGCSEGSVKTHCWRAVQALAKALKLRGVSP